MPSCLDASERFRNQPSERHASDDWYGRRCRRLMTPSAQSPRRTRTRQCRSPRIRGLFFLGGIFFVLLLTALYLAAEIIWPLVLAFVLSLLLNPLLRFLDRLHVPRVLGALLLVVAVLALVVGLGTAVSGPAASWAAKLPDGVPRLFQRLRFLEAPFAALQIENFAGWQSGANSSGSAFLTKLLTGTRSFASGFFTTLLFSFFFLSPGRFFCSAS